MVRKGLALLLLVLTPGVAHAQWHEASSTHFLVYSDDKPERVRAFADTLERFDQGVRKLRGMPNQPPGPANRVTVFVLDSIDDVGQISGRDGVAGFYIPRAGASVAFTPREDMSGGARFIKARAVLFHEYAHHLMLSVYAHSTFPAWLVEGWAEFHATARINPDGSITFGAPPLYRAYELTERDPVPLEWILAADMKKLRGQEISALYGRGWAITHYLTFFSGRAGQFGQYIEGINMGKKPGEAAAVFGDPKKLDREIEEYISKGRMPVATLKASAIDTGPITVRKLGPGEVATMDVRMRSERGVNEKTAPGVYAAAKKAAAPFPNDPAAQAVLAEAAFDAKDYAGAEAAADRALAANPNLIDALLYKAMSRMEVAIKAKDARPETWTGIRRIVATANRLDPDHPGVLELFYRTYTEAGIAPSASARKGLYYAVELAPHDDGLRLRAAYSYLGEGKPNDARRLLAPLAYDPHGGAQAAAANKLIEEIDRGEDPGGGRNDPDPAQSESKQDRWHGNPRRVTVAWTPQAR